MILIYAALLVLLMLAVPIGLAIQDARHKKKQTPDSRASYTRGASGGTWSDSSTYSDGGSWFDFGDSGDCDSGGDGGGDCD